MDDYQDRIVDRSAPRWAWDIIDETLALDASSGAFDSALRSDIRDAIESMVKASKEPGLDWLSKKAVAA